jgi:hypothetical protein
MTPDEYLAGLPEERREVVSQIREVINRSMPEGFQERVAYGMICWSVPHSTYPKGYHVDPSRPLGLLSLASQKNYIALYHMGMYASGPLLDWFQSEWSKHTPKRLDMGKSCIRFKKPEDVPLQLIGELAAKLSPQAWIEAYETALQRKP